MRFTSIASTFALTSAMMFGGAAYAQNGAGPITVNGLTVTEVDLPLVQEYCNQLAEGMEPDTPIGETPDADAGAADDDAMDDADDSEPTIDLGKITIEGCIEAGLTPAM